MIRFSVEKLHHFSCDFCKKWWAIGDFDPRGILYMVCPHCTKAHQLVEETRDLTKTQQNPA